MFSDERVHTKGDRSFISVTSPVPKPYLSRISVCTLLNTSLVRHIRLHVRLFAWTKVYFFGWGFFALGHDDALERKLVGQPPNPRTLPEPTGGITSHAGSRPAMPQQAQQHRISASSPKQERVVVGNNGVVSIDIETCTGDSSIGMDSPDAEQHDDRDGNDRWAELRQRIFRLLKSPNIIAVTIGVAIAMVAPLQRMLFLDPRAILRPLGAALQVRFELKVEGADDKTALVLSSLRILDNMLWRGARAIRLVPVHHHGLLHAHAPQSIVSFPLLNVCFVVSDSTC